MEVKRKVERYSMRDVVVRKDEEGDEEGMRNEERKV